MHAGRRVILRFKVSINLYHTSEVEKGASRHVVSHRPLGTRKYRPTFTSRLRVTTVLFPLSRNISRPGCFGFGVSARTGYMCNIWLPTVSRGNDKPRMEKTLTITNMADKCWARPTRGAEGGKSREVQRLQRLQQPPPPQK